MTRRRLTGRVAALVALGTLLTFATACGRLHRVPAAGSGPTGPTPSVSVSSTEAAVAQPDVPSIDWASPLESQIEVPSEQLAASLLTFQPIVPEALGSPTTIAINDPAEFPEGALGLGLEYFHPEFGHFWLMEEPTLMTQAELEGLAGCDPSTGCEGTWEVVELSQGIRGLLIAGSGSVGVMWLRDGVRFDLMGPPDTLTIDEAISAATAATGP
jgi:hypothetical protein